MAMRTDYNQRIRELKLDEATKKMLRIAAGAYINLNWEEDKIMDYILHKLMIEGYSKAYKDKVKMLFVRYIDLRLTRWE